MTLQRQKTPLSFPLSVCVRFPFRSIFTVFILFYWINNNNNNNIIIIIIILFYFCLRPPARSLQAKNYKLAFVWNGTLRGTKITLLRTCFWMLVRFPSAVIWTAFEKKLCFQWFECNLGNSLAVFSDKFGRFRVPRSSCFHARLKRNDVSWQVCCTWRFCLLLPCSLRLLRSLLSQQDEMRHMCRERSRPMREAFDVSKGLIIIIIIIINIIIIIIIKM